MSKDMYRKHRRLKREGKPTTRKQSLALYEAKVAQLERETKIKVTRSR